MLHGYVRANPGIHAPVRTQQHASMPGDLEPLQLGLSSQVHMQFSRKNFRLHPRIVNIVICSLREEDLQQHRVQSCMAFFCRV